MSLFGHSTTLRIFVDPDLLQYDEVWAAAGTWNDNFRASPADIVRASGAVVTDLKRACRQCKSDSKASAHTFFVP